MISEIGHAFISAFIGCLSFTLLSWTVIRFGYREQKGERLLPSEYRQARRKYIIYVFFYCIWVYGAGDCLIIQQIMDLKIRELLLALCYQLSLVLFMTLGFRLPIRTIYS